jgi:HD-GYP domain-containing protein (c-di-GMP phosphodiesterase class II)
MSYVFDGVAPGCASKHCTSYHPTSTASAEPMSQICRSLSLSAENAAFDKFREIFGPPIDLWLFDGQHWQQVLVDQRSVHEEGNLRPPTDWRCGWTDQPVAHELESGLLLVGMPLNSSFGGHTDDVGALVVWGTVEASAPQLAAALVRMSHRRESAEAAAREMQGGVEPHLEQICRDFEELTWLRELQEHLFESSVDDSLATVGGRILPDLRQLIAAECIALVMADASESGGGVCWCGPPRLAAAACRKLVAYLHSRSESNRPVIVNHLDRLEIDADFVGVLSCVQLPIVHGDINYGWLVAFNRSAEHSRHKALEKSAFADAVQNEFGTGDAGLLFSAAATLASHARNSELFRETERLLIGIIRAMINALDAKDRYTCGHSDRVAITARRIGQQLGLKPRECELLYMSGLLHDIGKIGIPDYVLQKPDRLTPEEFAIIAQHPSIGHAILSHLPQLSSVLPGVLYHHEHLDGRGYPEGRKGDDIPLFGRILAVADAYDAMTTCRPYRTAMPTEKAQAILRNGSGTQWDPAIVEAFFAVLPTLDSNAVHNLENLRSMYESVDKAGLASLGERTEVNRRLIGQWSSGLASKP